MNASSVMNENVDQPSSSARPATTAIGISTELRRSAIDEPHPIDVERAGLAIAAVDELQLHVATLEIDHVDDVRLHHPRRGRGDLAQALVLLRVAQLEPALLRVAHRTPAEYEIRVIDREGRRGEHAVQLHVAIRIAFGAVEERVAVAAHRVCALRWL